MDQGVVGWIHPLSPDFTPFAAAPTFLSWIAVILIVGFAVGIRLRLLEIPLERDEGEFAYMGQLMLQGIPPYLQAYNMKLPGIYAAYALVMGVFGQTVSGIHLGLTCINAASTLLLFLLTRRLFDPLAAVLAAAGFAVLSVSPSVYGTAAHATQFIVPLVLGGTLVLLKAVDSGRYGSIAMSGLLFGLAFTIKQHAIFFVAFAVVYYAGCILRTHPLGSRETVLRDRLAPCRFGYPLCHCLRCALRRRGVPHLLVLDIHLCT